MPVGRRAIGDVVLFAAALARPTLELSRTGARGARETVVEALDTAAREGVVEKDDSRLRFAHPLLAWGSTSRRRSGSAVRLQERCARTVTDIEERGPTMAREWTAPTPSPPPCPRRGRGAGSGPRGGQAAAAELSELAAELTPDDPGSERDAAACGLRSSIASPATGPGRSSSRSRDSSRSQPVSSAPDGPSRARHLDPYSRSAGGDWLLDEAQAMRQRRRPADADSGYRGWIRIFPRGPTSRGARRLPRGAREGRARRRPGPDRRGDADTLRAAEGRAGEFTPGMLDGA